MTNVPAGTLVQFAHVYACDRVVRFTAAGEPEGGVDSRGSSAPRCVEGVLGPVELPVVTRLTLTYGTTYQVGPVPAGSTRIYVVYKTQFGTTVSEPVTVTVSSGRVGGA